MCAKKRHTDSSDFLRYLKDDLSNQERHKLERSLEANPFEKEAMEGMGRISPEKAEADLLSLHASLNRRLGRRKRRTWYGIAATAASILLVGTIFLNIYDIKPDHAENEPLTEETFQALDSGKELEAPEASGSEEAKGKTEEAAAPEMVSEPIAETAQEEIAYDMVMEEDAEIVAVEAEPRRAKRTVQKENMATPEAFAPAPASEPAPKSSGQVSGVVISSEDMEPLPGASVFIRGTSSGTVADMDGRFTLPADDSRTTVVASFIGMETEEYQLRTGGDNRLVMQPDPVTLDELVVIDYSREDDERNLSSSTKGIKTEEAPPSYSSAEPIGGYKPFRDYVEENIVFPEGYTPGERELVILTFTVTSSGSISNIEPLRSPGEPFTREATRLLQQGPEWSSARVNGDPIDEQVRMRIVFKR